MAISMTEGADTRQNLGASGIIQSNKATFASADYVATGYPITPAMWGMGELHGVIVMAVSATAPTTTYEFRYNKTTAKLQVFGTGASSGAAFAEVSAGTDLSAFTVSLLAFGF